MYLVRSDAQHPAPQPLMIFSFSYVNAVGFDVGGEYEERLGVSSYREAFALAQGIELCSLVAPDDLAPGIVFVAGLFDMVLAGAVSLGLEDERGIIKWRSKFFQIFVREAGRVGAGTEDGVILAVLF